MSTTVKCKTGQLAEKSPEFIPVTQAQKKPPRRWLLSDADSFTINALGILASPRRFELLLPP